jgi:hypothetical protein
VPERDPTGHTVEDGERMIYIEDVFAALARVLLHLVAVVSLGVLKKCRMV